MQLRHLRTLAMRTGQTFVTPTSKVAAMRGLDQLAKQPASTVERHLDQQAIWLRLQIEVPVAVHERGLHAATRAFTRS
jgi:hypothetical protein